MSYSDCEDNHFFNHLIDLRSEEFRYLNSDHNWLTSDPNQSLSAIDLNEEKDIMGWINSAFNSEKSRGTHMSLVNKLDELKLMSPHSSVDTRTFTRQKRLNKRQSLFNGTGLSTLCSPVNEDEFSSPETNDRTFEVQTNNKSLNGTFTKALSPNNTFTLKNDDNIEDIQFNNIDDVEKIAKQQEDSLRQSCSNGWSSSRQLSPNRSHLLNNRSKLYSNNSNINSNTLTKSRDPSRQTRIVDHLADHMNHYHVNGEEADDQFAYQNGLSPEENTFRELRLSHNTSTPLVPKLNRYVNFNQECNDDSIGPKIMPDVSNLRANSSYAKSKIGRSEPNLSRRLQPLGYNSTKPNQLGNRTTNPTNRTFLEAKAPSDSRLVVNHKNGLRHPQNHNQTQTLGRVTSPPPPSQSQQQLLNRKVAVEGELNRIGANITNSTNTTTNLCRKSTFRVRDFPLNSDETIKDTGVDLCLTNATNASTNGYQTNKTINNNTVQRNLSKIPGPKSRSGIPVSGPRTAIPCPTNYRPANYTDNSWKNGCF